MKKQIVYIHGADAFSDYNAFLESLRMRDVGDPFSERPRRWPDTLRSELGDEFEVVAPSMPNKQNAKYEEWKIWFERHFRFLRDGVVLIGWSQGGYFLAKYLSENKVPFKVDALYLVATPCTRDDFGGGENGGDFNFDVSKLPAIADSVEEVVVFHSKDDPVVPYAHAEKYQELLPRAELVTCTNRGHFLRDDFPELIERLKARS